MTVATPSLEIVRTPQYDDAVLPRVAGGLAMRRQVSCREVGGQPAPDSQPSRMNPIARHFVAEPIDMRKPRSKTPSGDGADSADTKNRFAIGELADELCITTRTIRFYESKGLVAPERVGTTRVYSRRDRARLQLILRGKNLGFSLEDIARYLALYDSDPSQLAQTRMLLERIEAAIADLQRKRADLDRSLKELKEIRSACLDHLGARRDGS
jgi:DNA-binding transcriptional MerR regulator